MEGREKRRGVQGVESVSRENRGRPCFNDSTSLVLKQEKKIFVSVGRETKTKGDREGERSIFS